MEIKIDNRESKETKTILNIFFNSEEKMLSVGDIIVDDFLCIEHKTINDFISSVFDGRIFSQIEKMKLNYLNNYIMVSGSLTELLNLANDKNCYNSIIGAISSCYVRNCPIIFCDNLPNMCVIIKNLSEKLTDGKDRSITEIKLPIKDNPLKVICSFQGISQKKGKLLLDKFGSLQSIFDATEPELMEIGGIGKTIARNIFKVLNGNLYNR